MGYAQAHPSPIEPMKFVEPSIFADADAAARKLIEIANSVEAVQDGRSISSASTSPSLGLAVTATRSAPGSPARLRWGGSSGMRAARL
jgi:hypothetical protein